jgi:hypothetical protein
MQRGLKGSRHAAQGTGPRDFALGNLGVRSRLRRFDGEMPGRIRPRVKAPAPEASIACASSPAPQVREQHRDWCQRYARPHCGRREGHRRVEEPDGGCGRRPQPARALACALSPRREAARAPGQGSRNPLSARTGAPPPDALLAAAGPHLPPLGAKRSLVRCSDCRLSRPHAAPRRDGLRDVAPPACLRARAALAAMACRFLGFDGGDLSQARARLAQGNFDRLGMAGHAITGACHHFAAMGLGRLGVDPHKCGHSRASFSQACSNCLVMDRHDVAGACHRAVAMAHQNLEPDSRADPNSRARLHQRGFDRVVMDRCDVAYAFRRSQALALSHLEVDARAGAHSRAHLAQGNSARFVVDRCDVAGSQWHAATQPFRRRGLDRRQGRGLGAHLSRGSFSWLFLGRPQHEGAVARRTAYQAAS